MSVELHYPYDKNPRSVWNRRFRDLALYPIETLVEMLHKEAGFSIIGHVKNGGVQCCREVLFARTRCLSQHISNANFTSPLTPHQQRLSTASTPRVPCAWSQTEGVLKISMLPAEDALLSDWVAGYARNMVCAESPRLHVITTDLPKTRIVFNRLKNVSFHDGTYPPAIVARASVYHAMQWHIMWADNLTTAPHVFFWDVDSIPVMPLRCRNYFDVYGRPIWYYWSARDKSWIQTSLNILNSAASRGMPFVASPSSLPALQDFMTFFPVVIPRTAFTLARSVVVTACGNCTFDEAWANSRRPFTRGHLGQGVAVAPS
jgi:hypothetical protein